MDFVDELWAKLFPGNQDPRQPLIIEPLTRGEDYHRSYFSWLNNGYHRPIMAEIFAAWHRRKAGEEPLLDIRLLEMPAANGWALAYQPELGERIFQHLFDLLKERVQALGYRVQIAERRITDKKKVVETIEKYYLKPITDLAELPCEQRYGNVLIELHYRDYKPQYLKFMATFYSDRMYKPALPFSQLQEELLG